MSANSRAVSPIVPTDTETDLRVDCYVRSAVPGPTAESITAIVNRLQRLSDHGHLTGCHLHAWPPERYAATETDDTGEPSRHELLTEFEHWADQHGVTLEPAFRRQEIPPSPLGMNSDESRERVRVPLVALALYDETRDEVATDPLRGVVPYTEQLQTGDTRTYTVNEWLTAVGTEIGEISTADHQNGRQPLLERQQ